MKQYEEIANMRNSDNEITGFVMYDYDTEKFFCIDNEKLKQMCQQDLVRYLAYDSYSDSLVPYNTNEEIADMGDLYGPISTINTMDEYFMNDHVLHEHYRDYIGGNDFIIAVSTMPTKIFPVGTMVPFMLLGSQELIDAFISNLPELARGVCKKVRNFWSFTTTVLMFETLRDLEALNNVLFCAEFMGATMTPSFSDLKSRKVLKRNPFIKEVKPTELATLRNFFADLTTKNLSRITNNSISSMNLF